jgi:hypothetical protein
MASAGGEAGIYYNGTSWKCYKAYHAGMSVAAAIRRLAVCGSRAHRTVLFTCLAAVVTVLVMIQLMVFLRRPLLSDNFHQPNGLITNEFAYFNPHDPAAKVSAMWLVTSGSLFARDHTGWTGVPNRGSPGPRSANATDSSVFRLVTRDADFQNVAVSFSLLVQRFAAPPAGTDLTWQGVHVFLRYQSPYLLYVVSVDRRDGVIVIKKKVPGGPAAGGTYFTLAKVHVPPVVGRWVQVKASAVNNGADVDLKVWVAGRLRLEAVDNGVGDTAPITLPGRVGLRGDYTEFMFRAFTVSRS